MSACRLILLSVAVVLLSAATITEGESKNRESVSAPVTEYGIPIRLIHFLIKQIAVLF